jgi:DNA-directed RNA polymerase specialized sigma24 family protein
MIEEVEGDFTFSTWLTRIAMNEALMLLRQRPSNTWLFERRDHCANESSISSLADKAPNPRRNFCQERAARCFSSSGFMPSQELANRGFELLAQALFRVKGPRLNSGHAQTEVSSGFPHREPLQLRQNGDYL